MLLGGNQRARNFFKQHGWDEVGSDKIEAKYTSRAAQLYRRQLEKDVAKALSGDLPGPPVDSSSDSSLTSKAAAAPPKSRVMGSGPRKPMGRGGAKGGLCVKKMATKVDDSLFEQAPAEPEPEPEPEEAEPSMEDFAMPNAAPASSRFNLDVMEERKKPAAIRGKDGHLTIGSSAGDDFFSDPMGKSVNRTSSLDKSSPRAFQMGGVRRPQQAKATDVSSTLAQQKFGNAKSISSSAFFDEGKAENDYDKQTKLAQFQGSNAISSDAYFGREGPSNGKPAGYGAGNLDLTASELVSKIGITARQDLGQLKDMAGQASAKFSQFAQGFLRDLQGGY